MSGNVPIDTDKLMELAAQMGGQGSNEEARDMQEESLDAIDGMGMTQAEIEASMQAYQDTQSRSSPTLEALEQEGRKSTTNTRCWPCWTSSRVWASWKSCRNPWRLSPVTASNVI